MTGFDGLLAILIQFSHRVDFGHAAKSIWVDAKGSTRNRIDFLTRRDRSYRGYGSIKWYDVSRLGPAREVRRHMSGNLDKAILIKGWNINE